MVWPGIQSETALGAMAMNPYSRKSEFGEAYHAGSGETASFWRSYNSTGLFASVQTSFFESGEGFGAFRWGEEENTRWGYVNYGAWQLGAGDCVINFAVITCCDVLYGCDVCIIPIASCQLYCAAYCVLYCPLTKFLQLSRTLAISILLH